MPSLYLLRHAHAADAGVGQDDLDRPLDERGLSEAARVGGYLDGVGARVQAVLCSSARRTVETWAGAQSSWSTGAEVELSQGLYLASADELLASLLPLASELESVLVVAHNPGTQELALTLSGQGDRDAYERMRDSYPPAALSELEFDCGWSALRAGVATLVRFEGPHAMG